MGLVPEQGCLPQRGGPDALQRVGARVRRGGPPRGVARGPATRLADGRVLVIGGSADGWSYNDHCYAEAEIYDPATGSFTATGSMADALVAQTATLLPDGRVLIAGGHDASTDVAGAEIWDPETGTFAPVGFGG